MNIVRWLFIIELLYVASWPFCFHLFRCLPDGGFGLGRLLSMLILTYAAWLSASVGLFPYDTASLVSFLILYLVVSGLLFVKRNEEIRAFVGERKQLLLFEEWVFLAIFLLAVFLQSYKPDITLAEKEPDMMFLQSVLRGGSMPPEDVWFVGKPLNYYYLGYVVFASMIKLSAVKVEFGFNLAVASIVPLACLAAFSLAYNLTRRRAYALLAPLFLFGLGNFDAVLRAVRGGGIFRFDWWYEMFAHGSREIIPGTIHEFPCFSFLLGDLHPHYMFMPFSFLLLSLILVLFMRKKDLFPAFTPSSWYLHGGIFALVLGSVFMFNTWDYPSYVLLTFLAVFVLSVRNGGGMRPWILALWVLGLIILSAIFFLPFHIYFEPAAKAHLSLVDASKRSPLGAFLTINGLGMFVAVSYLISELARCGLKTLRPGGWLILCAAGVVLAAVGLAAGCVIAGVMAALLLIAAAIALSRCDLSPERLFLILLVFLCAGLFLGCEFFYLRDFYGERLQRQNTVFKYYFQAWILSSIIFAGGSSYVLEKLRGAARVGWISTLSVLVAASLIYPLLGSYHRCGRFLSGARAASPYVPTLDGAAYVRYRYPEEYRALIWIRGHLLQRDAVVLEATGDPYSFFGRVATFTGHPTILGWGNQESLWRDWTWKVITDRTQDITRIYNEQKKSSVAPLLKKYGIRYVYVGTLEKKKYNSGGLEGFEGEFPVVYRNKDVTVYRVP